MRFLSSLFFSFGVILTFNCQGICSMGNDGSRNVMFESDEQKAKAHQLQDEIIDEFLRMDKNSDRESVERMTKDLFEGKAAQDYFAKRREQDRLTAETRKNRGSVANSFVQSVAAPIIALSDIESFIKTIKIAPVKGLGFDLPDSDKASMDDFHKMMRQVEVAEKRFLPKAPPKRSYINPASPLCKCCAQFVLGRSLIWPPCKPRMGNKLLAVSKALAFDLVYQRTEHEDYPWVLFNLAQPKKFLPLQNELILKKLAFDVELPDRFMKLRTISDTKLSSFFYPKVEVYFEEEVPKMVSHMIINFTGGMNDAAFRLNGPSSTLFFVPIGGESKYFDFVKNAMSLENVSIYFRGLKLNTEESSKRSIDQPKEDRTRSKDDIDPNVLAVHKRSIVTESFLHPGKTFLDKSYSWCGGLFYPKYETDISNEISNLTVHKKDRKISATDSTYRFETVYSNVPDVYIKMLEFMHKNNLAHVLFAKEKK